MRRNEIAVCMLVLGTLLSSVGCATFVYSRYQGTSPVALRNESYLDSLNRRAKERARELRYHSKWTTTRHIGFFGTMTEYEKRVGAKVVIPW